MKNLMKQIATSLSLTLMVASLVVISPNHTQAKVKKQPGNSAKVKSHAKRLSVSNGNGWATFPSSLHSRSASEFNSRTLPHWDGMTISNSSDKNEVAIETIKLGRRGRARAR